MSVTLTRRPKKAVGNERLLTAADLAAMPSELPSGTVLYELDNGRLVVMAPSGDAHGDSEAKIVFHLIAQGDRRNLGKTRCGEVGVILWRNPDRVVGADAVFVAKSSLPVRTSEEGYLETIPELVVEIRSKNDSSPEVEQKVKDYLTAGVRVVWVPDPQQRTLTEYRRRKKPRVLSAKDTLTIEDIIPGFQIIVEEVF